jgi:hypothetical protein
LLQKVGLVIVLILSLVSDESLFRSSLK